MTTHAIEISAGAAPVGSTASAAPFATIEVCVDAAAVDADWAELEATAPCSIYQTRAFILPWAETLGRRMAIAPRYVLARDREGRPAALLPLSIARRGPFRIATWLGGKDSNFNLPLLRRPSAWTRRDVAQLLRETARGCGNLVPDAFELLNQPFTWMAAPNAFAQLPHAASPSAAYGTALEPNAETLFAAKLSKDGRKKLRKKEARLADTGPLRHIIVATQAEQAVVIEAFLAQKIERFRSLGIRSDFELPEMRAFIEAASAPRGTGIELHALAAGDRIVAVYGGAGHRGPNDGGQWSGMFNAFEADPEIAKSSPGDILLMRVMAHCCRAGFARFDLGIGEARYKAALCDEAIPLFDAVVPVTPQGHLYAAMARLRQRAKCRLKQDPRLLRVVNRLRAALP